MTQGNATSVEQLESMLRAGRISNEEYARLRDAMTSRPAEKRITQDRQRLRKSWTDRELGGVCGGIARYYDVSSTRIRIAFLLLFLLTGGTAMAIYLAYYLVLPWDDAERDQIPRFPWKYAVAVFVLAVAIVMLLQVVVPRAILDVSENVGSRLPAPVLLLLTLSDWVGGAGIVAIPIGLLILIGTGAALTRHPRVYGVFMRIVVGILIAILTLQVLTLGVFLLTLA